VGIVLYMIGTFLITVSPIIGLVTWWHSRKNRGVLDSPVLDGVTATLIAIAVGIVWLFVSNVLL